MIFVFITMNVRKRKLLKACFLWNTYGKVNCVCCFRVHTLLLYYSPDILKLLSPHGAPEVQTNLKNQNSKFNSSAKPQHQNITEQKTLTNESMHQLPKQKQLVIDVSESRIFPWNFSRLNKSASRFCISKIK